MSRKVKKNRISKEESDPYTLKSNESMFDHLRPSSKSKAHLSSVKSSGFNTTFAFVIGSIIFFGLLLGGVFTSDINLSNNQENDQNQNPLIDDNNNSETDITKVCYSQHSSDQLHYHFTLNIIKKNGDLFSIPANVGITSSCMYGMHTHDPNNLIHVEYRNNLEIEKPTVEDFFNIWGETLSNSQLLGETGSVILEIDGEVREGSPSSYAPFDQEVVVLRVI